MYQTSTQIDTDEHSEADVGETKEDTFRRKEDYCIVKCQHSKSFGKISERHRSLGNKHGTEKMAISSGQVRPYREI